MQFDALIDSMATRGFDAHHPVPLSSEDGLLRNGAHRLAAALAVGCDIAITAEAGPGGRWDHEWFRAHGFDVEVRNQLLRAWAEIKGVHAAVVVLWSPVEDAWPDIEAAVASAREGFRRWSRTPAPARGDVLRRVGDLLVERKEEIADAMTREMGKVLAETRGDVQEGIDTAYYAATEGRR